MRLPGRVSIFVGLTSVLAAAGASAQLPRLTEFRVASGIDGTRQPSLVWAPEAARRKPTPLFVFLHSWSDGYKQKNDKWQAQAVKRGWIYLHPNFRGRNDNPQACGSKLARQDILDAIEYVLAHYKVDESRIYLAGVSGGGHMTMLMAGRHARRFSAASAWVGISDLAEWHKFHTRSGTPTRYARMIVACCGGKPGESKQIDEEYRDRSPIHHIAGAADLPLDLHAGVNDGHTGSVPVEHALRPFNVLARTHKAREVSEAEMQQLWTDRRLKSPRKSDTAGDKSYGRAIVLRRYAGHARVTIFEGGHESLPAAACNWLARHRRATRR